MELKLAPMDLGNTTPQTIKVESLLESKGKIVYMGEVRYGLDAKDFIYEFRIL